MLMSWIVSGSHSLTDERFMEVRFESVTKKYGDFIAVNQLDLNIKSGALHFLLGPSGCGKTTTLRMLAGLESVSGGKLFFDGKDVTNLAAADRGIGMVFQNYALWPHMTVRENIAYGLKLKKLPKSEISERIEEVLAFTQLTNFADRLPGQLSGGQQQRVALARALAIRPSVLLLDEPLSNLDAKLRMEMRENILRIHKQTKITTVYVTHDQKEALSMGSHISVMHSGNLIQTDHPKKLYNHPNNPFIAGFIGETNFLDGKVVEKINNAHGEDGWLVDTSLGKILAKQTAMAECNPGMSVTLSIRPEAVAVLWEKQGESTNVFSLDLEHLTYLGESEQFYFRGTGTTSLKANLYHTPDHDFKEGDKVDCFMNPSDVLILPPQQDMGPGT